MILCGDFVTRLSSHNRDKRFFLLNADRNGGFRAQFSRNSMSVKTRDIPDHTTEEIKK